MEFEGKVVLISGATGGIGKSLVEQLSNEKCKIAIFSRSKNKLEKISKKINKGKSECIYKKCDVTKKTDVKNAVKFTKNKYGRIDVAFLNAGILIPNPIETFDGNILTKTMEVNFFGTVYFLEFLLPIMKKQDKSVIAVTSTLPDRRGVPGWGAYGASKAAISWLVESLRSEAKKKYNISMITIKPGSVETPMIKEFERKGSVSSENAAKKIIDGVKKEKRVIQFPLMQVLATRISDLFPPFAYDMQDIDMLKGEGYPKAEEKS